MAPQMASGNRASDNPGGPPVHRFLLALAGRLDAINRHVGHVVAWLALPMVVVQAALVIGRYVFGIGSIAAQESVLAMHGLLFTLAAGFALMRDAHVRVDVFYRRAGPRARARINLIGVVIFLLPFMTAIFISAWPYVVESWRTLEGSRETSGLPILFLVKTAIPVMAVLVALQGIAMAMRAAATLLEGTSRPGVAGG